MLNSSLLALRSVPAENLVAAHEQVTAELFATAANMESPSIVVVPACNEERDLPATLLSLSKSLQPVLPIVVENGSAEGDKTFEYAERMGAVALHCNPAKVRATQVGLAYARQHYPEQPVIHFGDADNIYPRLCVSAIGRAIRRASSRNGDNAALLFGMGAYDHGASAVVDLMRSGRVIRKAILRKIKGETPMPYGFNYAMHLGNDERFEQAIQELDPRLFVREESEICKAALKAGATITQLVSPTAYVFTRGDLINNRAEWRNFKGASMDTKTAYYKRKYADVDFLPNDKSR